MEAMKPNTASVDGKKKSISHYFYYKLFHHKFKIPFTMEIKSIHLLHHQIE